MSRLPSHDRPARPRFETPGLRSLLVILAVSLATVTAAPSAFASFPGRNGLLAVHTYRGDSEQLWVVRPDGSGLTRFPVYGEGAFSPDGRRLALAFEHTLAITDINGGSRDTIHRSRRRYLGDPAWSPAGDRIYGGSNPLVAVPTAGGAPRPIASDGDSPDVSVTGRVAYEVDPDYNDPKLFSSDPDGGDVRALGRGSAPTWSPDGRRIAFVRDGVIHAADPDGTNASPLARLRGGEPLYLAWSPDGREIAFVRDSGTLSVLSLASGAARDVLSERRLDGDLLFSLDWQALQGSDKIVLPRAPKLRGRCQMLGSRTIRRTKRARVFTENDRYYACLYSLGRIVELEMGGGLDPRLGEFAVTGRYLAYESESDDTEAGSFADLFVIDLRSRRITRSTNAVDVSRGAAYADVRKLVVSPRGSIAWVVRPFRDFTLQPLPFEVHKSDARGTRLLDSGRRIEPRSLVRRGARVAWRNGTRRRAASLAEGGR